VVRSSPLRFFLVNRDVVVVNFSFGERNGISFLAKAARGNSGLSPKKACLELLLPQTTGARAS
jgi:hypothetical protein